VGEISKFAPLVSVAMITYNHERFITKAIESVLAQRTRFPIELVVGEDASSDDTRRHIEVLRAQAPEMIRTLIRPANIGMHRNLEDVLQECRGEFIAFVEGDDYWTSEEKLQTQVDLMRTRVDAVGVFHSVTIVDGVNQKTGAIYPQNLETEVGIEIRTKQLLEQKSSGHNVVPTPSVMIRRRAIPTLPDSFRNLKMRDWPMWVFASLNGPWLYLPHVMAAYRVHDGGSWNNLNYSERRDSLVELFNTFAAELPQPFAGIARQELSRMHLAALEEALVHDRPTDARRELREIVPLISYFQMRHGKRLITAAWQTLSPRTFKVVKQASHLLR
jgi:glycosyltransferase involved in cell wall biosynthesis